MKTPVTMAASMLDYDAFASLAQDQFVPLHVHADHSSRFAGRMRGHCVGDIHAVDIRATPHSVERTPALVQRGGGDRYKLTLQLSGTALLIQDNREAILRPGDIAIYDTSRPYTLAFEQDCHVMVDMFPRRLINLPYEWVGQVTAVRFAGDDGLGEIIGPLLARMGAMAASIPESAMSRISHSALDMVTTMIGAVLDERVGKNDPRSQLVRTIRSYIDEHLSERELGPDQIAHAHYISTRTLHALFNEQGTTVSSWIREQRFEQCRRDLCDPLLQQRSIGEIAARWGIHDAPHFSRVFRSQFGTSPSDFRRSALL